MKNFEDFMVQKQILVDYLNLMIFFEDWEEVAATADRLHSHKQIITPSFLARDLHEDVSAV